MTGYSWLWSTFFTHRWTGNRHCTTTQKRLQKWTVQGEISRLVLIRRKKPKFSCMNCGCELATSPEKLVHFNEIHSISLVFKVFLIFTVGFYLVKNRVTKNRWGHEFASTIHAWKLRLFSSDQNQSRDFPLNCPFLQSFFLWLCNVDFPSIDAWKM